MDYAAVTVGNISVVQMMEKMNGVVTLDEKGRRVMMFRDTMMKFFGKRRLRRIKYNLQIIKYLKLDEARMKTTNRMKETIEPLYPGCQWNLMDVRYSWIASILHAARNHQDFVNV